MTPNLTLPMPADTRPEDRARQQEAAEILRERERIRESYLTIRREELDRLERIIEGCDKD